jgi:DNA-binding NarL/FixJ family response regulator
MVVMDVKLPGDFDGIEAAERIKEAQPNCRVIFVTAYGDQSTWERMQRVGPDAILQKPVRELDLEVAIKLAAAKVDGRPGKRGPRNQALSSRAPYRASDAAASRKPHIAATDGDLQNTLHKFAGIFERLADGAAGGKRVRQETVPSRPRRDRTARGLFVDADQFSKWTPSPGTRLDSEVARVLIVEDYRIQAKLLQALLAARGHTICGVACTGEQAVALAAAERPEVVLMDVQLPGKLDGVEAAARIQERRPCALVFVTAYTDPGTMQRMSQLAPAAIMPKPTDIRVLVETIAQASPQHG